MRRVFVGVTLAIALLGCVPISLKVPRGVQNSAGEAPVEEPTASPEASIIGGVVGSDGGNPSPTPRPNPTPTLTPSPTPSEAEYVPFAIALTVKIASDSINVPPPPGAPVLYSYATQASAEVLLSNGLKTSKVSWSSSNPSIATVDASGSVMAAGTAGTAVIIATSLDGRATGSVRLTVLNLGDLDVVVD